MFTSRMYDDMSGHKISRAESHQDPGKPNFLQGLTWQTPTKVYAQ